MIDLLLSFYHMIKNGSIVYSVAELSRVESLPSLTALAMALLLCSLVVLLACFVVPVSGCVRNIVRASQTSRARKSAWEGSLVWAWERGRLLLCFCAWIRKSVYVTGMQIHHIEEVCAEVYFSFTGTS